jgi:hypothetical protein
MPRKTRLERTGLCTCGHPPTPQAKDSCTTGYGYDSRGRTYCWTCCATRDRAAMLKEGKAVLYLTAKGPSGIEDWTAGNWPGSLTFPVHHVKEGSHNWRNVQRIDAWFVGPDGNTWHGINLGDSDILRCKRTQAKA